MYTVDGRVNWEKFVYHTTLTPGYVNRYENYIASTNSIDNDDTSSSSLTTLKRIGSPSQNAEVYLTKNDMIMKVLPIMNKNSFSNNVKEIDIAMQASQLVLEQRSSHFPIVYGFGECEETIFQSKEFNRATSEFQNGKSNSHLIFYELAICDLHQYIDCMTSEKFREKQEYIHSQCLEAIQDMHTLLMEGNTSNILCHNDLHLRNFLVLPYDCKEGFVILITDFGCADYRDSYQEMDIEFFEEEWSKLIKLKQ